MLLSAALTTRVIRRLVAAPAVLLAALLGTCNVQAAPDFNPDPVGTFLIQSGLADSASAIANAPAAAASATVAVPDSIATRIRDQASGMVLTAMNFLGVKYRRGGTSEDKGFDCSGFTRHVFETSLGFVLPRRADEQAKAPGLTSVKLDELKPGDLVFFNTLKRTFSHVGIYIGDGKFIHSPRPGGEVRVESLTFAYWKKRFTGARRAEMPDNPGLSAAARPASGAMPTALPATTPPADPRTL